ncbi:MAG: 2-hydroxyacid dehydrogenase [Hydrogenovibrio crunogenus]|nr:2-hydroxyacid dehydrogenase [Hydrogenovibrio crunogenus]
MKVAFFSATKTDKNFFETNRQSDSLEFVFLEAHLSEKTVPVAQGVEATCVFVNDDLSETVIRQLAFYGVKLIALRCAGFNNVDIEAARQHGLTILRVPAYSPMAVAEHALALMMSLNRKTYRAYNRIRDGNFALEGLLGFDMFQKTAGIMGTGRIGLEMTRILTGLGLNVLVYDPFPNQQAIEYGAEYVSLATLYQQSDIISLHMPLLPETHHIIDADAIAQMKPGVMLINTSRGALMDADALIAGLKSEKIGYLGIDVYEQEENLFFEDHSEEIIQDDAFERLVSFPNVLITGHQAFFTQEALANITQTTIENILDYQQQNIKHERCVLCEDK